MTLWKLWYEAIALLRPAFSRSITFAWFAVAVAGISIRSDRLGVTSVVRALALNETSYHALLRHFESQAIKLDQLSHLWVRSVFSLFGDRIERVNERVVLLADGKKIAKQGRKMPGVKLLHQSSENNSKPAYIMGHSTQAVSLLVNAASSVFAVPLQMKIHEGVVFSNRSNKTLIDRLLDMIGALSIPEPYYLVADAYYSNGKMIKGMLGSGNNLITRARSNAVAYFEPAKQTGQRTRGRPKTYGHHVKLKQLFNSSHKISKITSPVYGEKGVTLKVRSFTLLWKPAGRLTRFVLVQHPTRGKIILMCTDLDLSDVQIIRLYGLRFKIELGFKQASQIVGAYDYRFWMAQMTPQRHGGGDQYLHRCSNEYRLKVRLKLRSYHVHLFMGVVAQGLMQYLSSCHAQQVWASFGSWLRTIRQDVAPSERVAAMALRNSLPEFLVVSHQSNTLAKFIIEHQDPDRADILGIAA